MESPPGYEQFCDDLWTLLSSYPPPFIYIQDTESTRTTFSVVHELLRSLSDAPPSESSSKIYYARVDAISCFTPRLIFETVIHSLVGWEPRWEEGCAIWKPGGDSVRLELRWNENLDTFLHGLRAAHAHLCERVVLGSGNEKGKGKGKAKEEMFDNVRFVIVVERPERLKEGHPELMVPFTRLAELVRFLFFSLGRDLAFMLRSRQELI
jgi:origin recognition complex subunit 5